MIDQSSIRLYCHHNGQTVPLIHSQSLDKQYCIWSQYLPILIHNPHLPADNLLGFELFNPSKGRS